MRDFNPSQGFSPPKEYLDNEWSEHEKYWQENWHTRPYVSADLGFDYYKPAYRYGYDAHRIHRDKKYEDVRTELRAGWDTYQYRGKTAWESIEQAVQDGWRRAAERINQS
jgi:hypothetical protein